MALASMTLLPVVQACHMLCSQHIALPLTFSGLGISGWGYVASQATPRVLCPPQVPLEEREQRLRLAAFDPATDVQHLKVIYKDPALEGGCMSRKQLSQIK